MDELHVIISFSRQRKHRKFSDQIGYVVDQHAFLCDPTEHRTRPQYSKFYSGICQVALHLSLLPDVRKRRFQVRFCMRSKNNLFDSRRLGTVDQHNTVPDDALSFCFVEVVILDPIGLNESVAALETLVEVLSLEYQGDVFDLFVEGHQTADVPLI